MHKRTKAGPDILRGTKCGLFLLPLKIGSADYE